MTPVFLLPGLELKKAKQTKHQKVAVGFFNGRDGETHPITKSSTELSRKKIVKGPRKFKAVAVARARDVSQKLEDLMEELVMVQNNLLLLNEQQKQLAEQNKESPLLDREVERTRERAALLKNQIRILGS